MNKDKKPKIFLSYAHEDIGMAKRIFDDLKRYGLDIWFDKESILGGQNWRYEAKRAIQNCDFFIAVLSSKSITKIGEVQRELKTALDILEKHPKSEVYIVPVRIEDCKPIEEKLSELHWIDAFPENEYEEGIRKILKVVSPGTFKLRSTPKELSAPEVNEMIIKHGFYESNRNPGGRGYSHEYKAIKGGKVIIDEATGLMWQQSGSSESLLFDELEGYIEYLNKEEFAGFDDWRLPTLEEAMSLMETEEKNGDLYIDSVFDKTKGHIWTSDKSARLDWVIVFYYGYCTNLHLFQYGYYVRAVRSR